MVNVGQFPMPILIKFMYPVSLEEDGMMSSKASKGYFSFS